MKQLFLAAAFIGLPAAATAADNTDIGFNCTLTYKGKIYAQGPCEAKTYSEAKQLVISATVPENGVAYTATLSEERGTGLLLGAGTFVLADGPVETLTAGASYIWENGYALDVGGDVASDE